MYELIKGKRKNLETLFINTAARKNMNTAIIEKDFWVCFLLDLLFHKSKYSKRISFKGGTSLSKGYNVIKRFSEDIDLIIDWRLLGYSINKPWEKRSITKQIKFNEEAGIKTEKFLKNKFVPHLEEIVKTFLSDYSISIDGDNPQTIQFNYPQIFSDKSILQEIRLEMGPLAQWTPCVEKNIIPYAAEEYPKVFNKGQTFIRMVEAKRTFWEKATILHREANRKNGRFPARYSRHYYDLYMLSKSPIKQEALDDIELLESVIKFKDKFYHSTWAKYDEAHPKTIKLLPPDEIIGVLKEDYNKMQAMIFGEKPSFDEIIEGLRQLENDLKKLK